MRIVFFVDLLFLGAALFVYAGAKLTKGRLHIFASISAKCRVRLVPLQLNKTIYLCVGFFVDSRKVAYEQTPYGVIGFRQNSCRFRFQGNSNENKIDRIV